MISRQISPIAKLCGLSLAGITTAYYIDKTYFASVSTRTLRTGYTLALIAADYKLNFDDKHDIESLHERNSQRLFNLFITNKGLSIKLGQIIAMQGSLLPKAFQLQFRQLFDNAPQDEWESVDRVLRQELGHDYMYKYFSSIDKDPIASASIAQVHRAVLKTGEQVVLKVQHESIRKQIDADLATYRLSMRFYQWAFGIPFSFVTGYVSDQMKQEVDFVHEAANAEMLCGLIENDAYFSKKMYVPRVYREMTTKRLLVNEWIEGTSLVDPEAMVKKGFSLKEIMYNITLCYARQVFQWGVVHCDPHPGNFLVRKRGKGTQVVVLDHGLYVTYGDPFRRDYATLWKSIMELNTGKVKQICRSWGVLSDDLFASFTVLNPKFMQSREAAERSGKMKSIPDFEKQKIVKDKLINFFNNTDKFPLQLVFLSRSMRMIQTLNQRFRSPVNRMDVLAGEAVRSLRTQAKPFQMTSLLHGSYWKVLVSNAFRLAVYQFARCLSLAFFYSFKIKQLVEEFFGVPSRGPEDVIEDHMIDTMKSFGLEVKKGEVFSG